MPTSCKTTAQVYNGWSVYRTNVKKNYTHRLLSRVRTGVKLGKNRIGNKLKPKLCHVNFSSCVNIIVGRDDCKTSLAYLTVDDLSSLCFRTMLEIGSNKILCRVSIPCCWRICMTRLSLTCSFRLWLLSLFQIINELLSKWIVRFISWSISDRWADEFRNVANRCALQRITL